MEGRVVKPGDRLGGKYEVEAVLGEGGMGIVLRARHRSLGHVVAIKVMQLDAARDQELRERFEREARAAVVLKGHHVTKVLDVGNLEDGCPFIVMEHLEGRDLASVLQTSGRLAVGTACGYLLQALEALAEAHAHGIVHRDIKPANLFLAKKVDGSPLIKVLDFGLAKLAKVDGEGMVTASTASFGSPSYMAPEQMRSARDVDARTDIWSLGVTLYELVSGASPFVAETVPEIFAAVLNDSPRPLEALRDDLPPGFSQVVAKCLAKSPSDRYQNVASLAAALEPFAAPSALGSSERLRVILTPGSASTAATLPNVAPDVGAQGAARTGRAWSSPTPKRLRAGGNVLLKVVLAGLALVAIVLAVLRVRTERQPASSNASATSEAPTIAEAPQLPPDTSNVVAASVTASATSSASANAGAPSAVPARRTHESATKRKPGPRASAEGPPAVEPPKPPPSSGLNLQPGRF